MIPPRLEVHHEFCLDFAASHVAADGKVLDFGCGAGQAVVAGLRRGLDIYGCDIFYDASPEDIEMARSTGLFDTRIRRSSDGKIPYEDGFFDFVFHDQVFEHVCDIDLALSEIARVLKPSGKMLSLYPSKEVICDRHYDLLLAHRFKPDSKLGIAMIMLFGAFGYGLWREEHESLSEWARKALKWLNDWCYYRSRNELIGKYSAHGFDFQSYEIGYATYRLTRRGRTRMAYLVNRLKPLAQFMSRRTDGLVIVSQISK